MTRRRKILAGLGGVILIAALIAVLNIKGMRLAYRQWQRDREEAYLAQHVNGYLPRDWEETSSLIVRGINYLGGHVSEYRWSKLGAQYREYYRPQPDVVIPEWSSPISVDDAAKQAIRDAVNIAIRDKLWDRGEVRNPPHIRMVDGGETVYEFVLGPNSGTLRVIQNPDVPDLRLFRHKIALWTEGVRRQMDHLRSPQSGPAAR